MNQLNQRAIAKECSKWVKEKVKFKSNASLNQPLNGVIHVNNGDSNESAYNNITNFTTADLKESLIKLRPDDTIAWDNVNDKYSIDAG